MAEGNDLIERVKYAFENAPREGGAYGGMRSVLWAMGLPTGVIGGPNLNEHFYMQAIRRGQNPYETLPWLNGGAKPGAGAGPTPDASPVEANGLPKYYADWFRTRGKYGGVPPVQGLL